MKTGEGGGERKGEKKEGARRKKNKEEGEEIKERSIRDQEDEK